MMGFVEGQSRIPAIATSSGEIGRARPRIREIPTIDPDVPFHEVWRKWNWARAVAPIISRDRSRGRATLRRGNHARGTSRPLEQIERVAHSHRVVARARNWSIVERGYFCIW